MGRNVTYYGAGCLRERLEGIDKVVVVTDEAPWELHRARFASLDAQPVTPGTLERSVLDQIVPTLPDDAEILGLGGGSVIDAAKYFAHLRGKVPILVPTITSSNAQFSDFISIRSGGRPVGMKGDDVERQIVVDYELIRAAEPRLNRAGYGDLLSLETTLLDWRQAAAAGTAVAVDETVGARIEQMMDRARGLAEEIAVVSDPGIELLMRLFEESTNTMMEHPDKPVNAGGEHLFGWNLEGVTGRHFLHGEIVALGSVICEHLHRPGLGRLRGALERARVRFRLAELELQWPEVEQTLLSVRAYNEEVRKFRTVFDHVEWTPELLEEIRELVH